MIDPADIRSARILIVDDCCDTASTLCELLKWKGYKHVSWTTDGKAVVGLMAAHHYDLILLDMHMPSLSGLEIMHDLHATKPVNALLIIAISGDQRYKVASVAAGAHAFLIKPFSPEELEATIIDALSTPVPPLVRGSIHV